MREEERERRVERERVCSLDLCGAQTSVDAVGQRWEYLHSTFGFLSEQDKTNFPPSLDGELLTRGDLLPLESLQHLVALRHPVIGSSRRGPDQMTSEKAWIIGAA